MPEGARVLDVEMNMGQMIDDVRLAGEGSRAIEFFGRAGGIVPSPEQVLAEIRRVAENTTEHQGCGTVEPERPWPLCDLAQADGVPCQELGRDCDTCEAALPPPRHRSPREADA